MHSVSPSSIWTIEWYIFKSIFGYFLIALVTRIQYDSSTGKNIVIHCSKAPEMYREKKKTVSGIFFLWPWTDSMKETSTGRASKSFETGLYTQLRPQHIFKFLKSHFIIHINTDVCCTLCILTIHVWCACACIKFVYIIDMDCMCETFFIHTFDLISYAILHGRPSQNDNIVLYNSRCATANKRRYDR